MYAEAWDVEETVALNNLLLDAACVFDEYASCKLQRYVKKAIQQCSAVFFHVETLALWAVKEKIALDSQARGVGMAARNVESIV